jgi:hypothetical protein
MVLNPLRPCAGDELGERLAPDASEWKINYVGIAEQIEKKRLNGLQRVRSAKLEKHYPQPPFRISHPPGPQTKERPDVTPNHNSSSMFDGAYDRHWSFEKCSCTHGRGDPALIASPCAVRPCLQFQCSSGLPRLRVAQSSSCVCLPAD